MDKLDSASEHDNQFILKSEKCGFYKKWLLTKIFNMVMKLWSSIYFSYKSLVPV